MILAPIVFLQVPLRSSSDDLTARGNLTIIEATTRPHAPPENSAQDLTRSTHRLDPTRASTRLHALPRAFTRLNSLADVIADISPSCTVANVTCLRQPLTSSFDFGDLTVDFLGLTVDFDRAVDFSPGLTFAVQVLLTQFFT